MTDGRRIATVTSYDELIAAFRARADELKVTRETLDSVTGLQTGYSGKLLAPVPMKSLGRVSLGPMLQAMGLAIVLVEDPEALRRFAGQHAERKRTELATGKPEILTRPISLRKLRRMARLGGIKRAEKLSPKKRKMIALKAAMAGVRKRRRRARLARSNSRQATHVPDTCE